MSSCVRQGSKAHTFAPQDIVNGPDEILSSKTNQPIPRKLSVDYISFSAHVGYSENSDFIEQVKPKHIVSRNTIDSQPYLPNLVIQVLVHGDQTAMGRLRSALQSRYKDRDEDVKVYTPRNLEQLDITFRGERVAKVRLPLPPTPSKPNTPS